MSRHVRRSHETRFRPAAEGLEGRALMAAGQISLYFPSAATPLAGATQVKGTLPDGSIDIHQFTLSTSNPTNIGVVSGGSGSGRIQFDPLEIVFDAGPQSAGLFQAESGGAHFNSMILTIRDAAARVVETYNFKLVFVTSQIISGEQDSPPTENDKLVFGALQITTYNPNAPTLTILRQATWSQVLSQPTFDVPGVTSLAVKAGASTSVTTTSTADGLVASPAATAMASPTTIKLATSRPQHGSTTLTARVTLPGGVPTGNVTFYAGKTQLGQVAVGADGKASLTVPTSLVGRNHAFAIYSGGPGSTFQSATTITNKSAVSKNFQKWLGRPMNQDEWVLTSMWLQEGFTPSKMNGIYKSLAGK